MRAGPQPSSAPSVGAALRRGQPAVLGSGGPSPIASSQTGLPIRAGQGAHPRAFTRTVAAISIIGLSCSLAHWCMHTIHHSKLGSPPADPELRALWLGGCQPGGRRQGGWAMWALEAIWGGQWAVISEGTALRISARQLVTRGSPFRNVSDAGKFGGP